MTLRAKRIVPIRVSPTCVGTALTSSSSLGRASDGSRSGGSLHCGRKTPQKGIGQIPPVGKGSGPRVWKTCTCGAAPLSSRQCHFSMATCNFFPPRQAARVAPRFRGVLPASRAGNRLAVESQGGTATVGLPAVWSGALAGGHHRLRPRASRSSRLSSASCSECRGAYSSLHLLPGPPSIAGTTKSLSAFFVQEGSTFETLPRWIRSASVHTGAHGVTRT